ncbi:hypothetical protein NRB20_75120 [Nocardia sp. RB20]|uniref:Uncharacterized protein n=1 Tax=Nocardia macrotermitis TaxID=2585198 RepID=A0A7K0DFA2_9NOCA|nr:hypothetical protein [Nocardia macrotermitis]
MVALVEGDLHGCVRGHREVAHPVEGGIRDVTRCAGGDLVAFRGRELRGWGVGGVLVVRTVARGGCGRQCGGVACERCSGVVAELGWRCRILLCCSYISGNRGLSSWRHGIRIAGVGCRWCRVRMRRRRVLVRGEFRCGGGLFSGSCTGGIVCAGCGRGGFGCGRRMFEGIGCGGLDGRGCQSGGLCCGVLVRGAGWDGGFGCGRGRFEGVRCGRLGGRGCWFGGFRCGGLVCGGCEVLGRMCRLVGGPHHRRFGWGGVVDAAVRGCGGGLGGRIILRRSGFGFELAGQALEFGVEIEVQWGAGGFGGGAFQGGDGAVAHGGFGHVGAGGSLGDVAGFGVEGDLRGVGSVLGFVEADEVGAGGVEVVEPFADRILDLRAHFEDGAALFVEDPFHDLVAGYLAGHVADALVDLDIALGIARHGGGVGACVLELHAHQCGAAVVPHLLHHGCR